MIAVAVVSIVIVIIMSIAIEIVVRSDAKAHPAPDSQESLLIAYHRARYMRDEISAEELDESVGRVLGLEEEPVADRPLTYEERQAVSARSDVYSRGFFLDGSYIHPREDQER